jgi:hypothetical protein
MSIKKVYDVTQFDPNQQNVLRTILDQMASDTITFKYTTKAPTVDNVNYNEVALYDNGLGTLAATMKTGKGNLISLNNTPSLSTVPIKTITANYTINNTDYAILANAFSGPITVTLPTAVGSKGKMYWVKRINAGGNTVTVAPVGGQKMDGSATKVFGAQWQSITIVSDDANWFII